MIAGCRATLAGFSLLALWLDPSEPARLAQLAYGLVAGYALYAVILATWVWRARAIPPLLPAAVHSADLALFAFVVFVTEGGTSPFFVWFVFALAAATVRWQEIGALWTAVVALVLFLVAAFSAAILFPGSEIELNRVVIRTIYLTVVAVLLGYLGAHENRLRSRAAALADWPPVMPSGESALVEALLFHVARALSASRVVLVWEEAEEPWCHVATLSAGKLDLRREAPESALPLAPPELAATAFLLASAQGSHGGFRMLLSSGLLRMSEDPVPRWLRDRFGSCAVLSVPVLGESLSGRFFALDQPEMTSDELVLGEILARQVAVRLDRLALFERFHGARLAEERIRLARDLHDGVIQSLAAAGLRLESVRQVLHEEPERAARLIDDVQDLLASEQRELREILATLEPEDSGRTRPPLADRLDRLMARMARHWNLEVKLEDRLGEHPSVDGTSDEIYRVVQEALVNASRHGRASRALVELEALGDEVRLTIADNGSGFPFRGRYDSATLAAARLGPVSLKQRIAALGGRLEITSAADGARLDVYLPAGGSSE